MTNLSSERDRLILQGLLGDRFSNAHLSGMGSFGKVFCFRDASNNCLTAAKIFTDDDENEGLSTEFLREVGFLQLLSTEKHANLLDMYGFCITATARVILTRGMDQSLHQFLYLSKNVLQVKLAEKLNLCQSICQGIVHMHAMGFMHRDIKPQNILINNCDTNDVRIGDFGSTRLSATSDRKKTLMATTMWWAAPELLFGCDTYNESIDVWSLACTCVEIMEGSPLFAGNGTQVDQIFIIFSLIGTVDMHWASKCPAYCNDMLGKFENSVHVRLEERCNCPTKFINAIASALSGDPLQRINAATLCNTVAELCQTNTAGKVERNIQVMNTSEKNESNVLLHSVSKLRRRHTSLVKVLPQLNGNGPLSLRHRTEVLNWLVMVQDGLNQDQQYSDLTLYLAVDIFDRYTSNLKFGMIGEDVHLAVIVCFLIACKVNEVAVPSLQLISSCCENKHSLSKIAAMETRITSTTGGDVMKVNEEAIKLTRISDNALRGVAQYFFEISMIKAPFPKLNLQMAKRTREGCITKELNPLSYDSIKKKFPKLHASLG